KRNRAVVLLGILLLATVPLPLWQLVMDFRGGSGETPPAHAATGDVVQTLALQPCPGGNGVGIAFDSTHLWYSCTSTGASPDLYRVEPRTGQAVASFRVAGGLGAIAWDTTRKKLWAGWGDPGPRGSIRLIDPQTGAAEIKVTK